MREKSKKSIWQFLRFLCLQEEPAAMDDDEPEPKRRKLDPAATKSRKRRFGPVWMIPHLIKSLKVNFTIEF